MGRGMDEKERTRMLKKSSKKRRLKRILAKIKKTKKLIHLKYEKLKAMANGS